MSASVFDSVIFGGLFADPGAAAVWTDEALVEDMIRFEAALARAQADAGVIDADEGRALADALRDAKIDPLELRHGAQLSAVPVPALIPALRAQLPQELGRWLHWGATSQDVLDTATALRLRATCARIDALIEAASRVLGDMADAHRATPRLAATWSRAAAPTSFGLTCATWLAPLTRSRARLRDMEARVFALQLGGAVGDLSAMGPQALAVRDRMADALGLAAAAPWHAQRDRVLEAGGWMASAAAACGRIGADFLIMSGSSVGEIRLAAAGGSSTMPQKRNPVGPSKAVASARAAAGRIGDLHHAAIHADARDGAAWLLEWTALGALAVAAAGAARAIDETVRAMSPDPGRMAANLAAAGRAPLSEAYSFALAEHMSRGDAQILIKDAIAAGGDLVAQLRAATDAPIDWEALSDPAAQLGSADALIDAALEEAAQFEEPAQ